MLQKINTIRGEVLEMKFDVDELQKKLDGYFTGKITKMELGEWANKAYYDLLKGSYIEIEKVIIYPFLKILSTLHLAPDERNDVYPCTEESAKRIQDIINGNIDFDFDIEMSIPIQVYNMFKERSYYDKKRREIFVELRSAIASFFEQGCLFDNDIRTKLEPVMSLNCQEQTIQGVLEKRIVSLVRILFANNSITEKEKESFKLYAQKSGENLIAERLLNYLDSYIGNNNFHLLVSYKKGVSDFFIIV